MIERLIRASAARPFLVLGVVALLAALGSRAMLGLPLDAVPDLSDTQVIVLSEWPGRSPDLVEAHITQPITSALLSAPRVRWVRGQSMFGMSFVYVVFADGTDPYWARSRVLEHLRRVERRLPAGVVAVLGPDATALGWVLEYALVDRTGRLGPAEIRSLQDWQIGFALGSVPGVAEVAAIGGAVKRYEVNLDPLRLEARGLAVGDVIRAVEESNDDAGGQALEIAGHEHVLRARGYLQGSADIAAIPLRPGPGQAPVRVGDVATVTVGADARRGFADLDGMGEVTGGIVVMRQGENALRVIDAVKERIEQVRRGLPEGVELVITYDRSELIRGAVATLQSTLLQELVVVSLVIVLMLRHAPSAAVPLVGLPLAVLVAFLPMYAQGLSVNIMTLGGIAVAVGAMVDASIVLVENAHKRLEGLPGAGPLERRTEALGAMAEVGPTIFFSLLVITVSFFPVFALGGVEGRMFRPLAFTKTWAMAMAAVLAVTLTPALVGVFVRGRIRAEDERGWVVSLYVPVVRFVVRRRWPVIGLALALVLLTVPAFLSLGHEFLPPLDEGSLLYMPTAPPGMAPSEARRVLRAMDREIAAVPEVARVFGKVGRAETATDPAPLSMVETVITLEPRASWRPGLDREGLVAELDQRLRWPGMPNVWWMPVQTRTEMLSTGIRSPLAVKVFSPSVAAVEQASLEVEKVLGRVPGTRSAYAERSSSGFYLDVQIDRERAARFGIRARDLNQVVESAIGGRNVTETVEGRERYLVTVRYAREFRDHPEAVGRALVRAPGGVSVPLAEVAEVSSRQGPAMLQSENGQLLGFVLVDPGERPVGDWVGEARVELAKLTLPAGVRLEWAGQIQHLERARDRLLWVVPATLAIVVLLLWLNTGSIAETAMVLLAVPFSLIGAVWLLWLLDYHLSVAVWVGLIALAGLDAETGVVMLLYLKIAHSRRLAEGRLVTAADLEEAVVEGAARRLRPKLMTVLTDMLGLLPLLWSQGLGADVMKRMAAPMVGGLATSFLLELLVYPALWVAWRGRGLGVRR